MSHLDDRTARGQEEGIAFRPVSSIAFPPTHPHGEGRGGERRGSPHPPQRSVAARFSSKQTSRSGRQLHNFKIISLSCLDCQDGCSFLRGELNCSAFLWWLLAPFVPKENCAPTMLLYASNMITYVLKLIRYMSIANDHLLIHYCVTTSSRMVRGSPGPRLRGSWRLIPGLYSHTERLDNVIIY